ncbi:putative protein Thf1 [Helianthus annuus]|nr:putative protein Thf1 [Helianthus annuus]
MATVASLSFSTLTQSSSERKTPLPSLLSDSSTFKLRTNFSFHPITFRSYSPSRFIVRCMSTLTGKIFFFIYLFFFYGLYELYWHLEPPPVAETKLKFLNAYKRPIPSIYNTVLQELIVQQHLMRYKKTYRYDAVFALGFVTVYDQLMEGYPSDEDREAIFQAYVNALNEDPQQYRADAQKLETWARAQDANSLVDFASKTGECEDILKDIAERAGGSGSFSYSRFFAVGLFRLLELANATEPTILEKVIYTLTNNSMSCFSLKVDSSVVLVKTDRKGRNCRKLVYGRFVLIMVS